MENGRQRYYLGHKFVLSFKVNLEARTSFNLQITFYDVKRSTLQGKSPPKMKSCFRWFMRNELFLHTSTLFDCTIADNEDQTKSCKTKAMIFFSEKSASHREIYREKLYHILMLKNQTTVTIVIYLIITRIIRLSPL